MDSMSPIRDQMAALYGASTDIPHVMGVAVDLLADLQNATVALGRALVDAGLPQRAWRSEQTTLRLLSPALPAITIDAFLTRLQQFAARDGPRWLRGTRDELVVFHRGVVIVANVARPLQEVVDRLPPVPVDLPGRPRDDRALQHVMRHRALQPPLDTIVALLNELEALAPSMRPLTTAQWRAVRRSRRGPVARLQGTVAAWASGLQLRLRRGAPSSSETASEAAPQDVSVTVRGAADASSALGRGSTSALQRPSLLRRRGRAQGWLAVVALGITVGAGLALFVFARQPQTTSETPALSSSAVLTALAGAGTAAASATEVATHSPTALPTLAPTPKLALTCAVQGATATLTLKNVSAFPLTWQAQPPPTLTVSPAQGTLQTGQSAAVQVSAVNKKTPSGTITVIATHDTLTTQDKVSCR